MVALPNSRMTNRRLDQLIRQLTSDVQGELGFWQINYNSRQILIVTDESHDRMRIMSPILDETDLTDDDRQIVLEANFDRALDAKYAVSRGYLWSVFMHPLSDLTDTMFLDCVNQVRNLAENYGSTYTSSELIFGPGES